MDETELSPSGRTRGRGRRTASPPRRPLSKAVVLLLVVGFVGASLAALLLAFSALSFLADRPSLRSSLGVLVALVVALGLTIGLMRWRPAGRRRARFILERHGAPETGTFQH